MIILCINSPLDSIADGHLADSEMAIILQEFYKGTLLGSTPVEGKGQEGSRIGPRDRWSYDADSTDASADPTGSSEDGMAI